MQGGPLGFDSKGTQQWRGASGNRRRPETENCISDSIHSLDRSGKAAQFAASAISASHRKNAGSPPRALNIKMKTGAKAAKTGSIGERISICSSRIRIARA